MNKSYKTEPKVSVVCLAYNHERYIKDAINGFIAQKTTFPFEVIIHDDASTDATAEIIKNYAQRYPEIIVPVLETENQYSQGCRILKEMVMNVAKGDYIAICEGDDYWVSSDKLQRQYQFLESHPAFSACLHNAYICDAQNDVAYLSEPDDLDREKDFSTIAAEGCAGKNPTASFFFRKDCLQFKYRGPIGDYFILTEIAMHGLIKWLKEPMSVYRLGSEGSWTIQMQNYNAEQSKKFHNSFVGALMSMKDDMRDAGCREAIDRRITYQNRLLLEEGILRKFIDGEYGVFDLLGSGMSVKALIKALAERYLGKRSARRLKRLALIAMHSRDKTLVSKHLDRLKEWSA